MTGTLPTELGKLQAMKQLKLELFFILFHISPLVIRA